METDSNGLPVDINDWAPSDFEKAYTLTGLTPSVGNIAPTYGQCCALGVALKYLLPEFHDESKGLLNSYKQVEKKLGLSHALAFGFGFDDGFTRHALAASKLAQPEVTKMRAFGWAVGNHMRKAIG